MDPQHTRQVLELLFPSAVLDEILTRHAHPDKNASMQQLLNNMYPEHVQALLFSRLKQTGGCNDHQNSQTQHGECSKGHSRQHQQAASTSRFEIEQEPVENQQEAFAQAWDLRFPPPTENAFGYWISQAQTKTDQFAAAGVLAVGSVFVVASSSTITSSSDNHSVCLTGIHVIRVGGQERGTSIRSHRMAADGAFIAHHHPPRRGSSLCPPHSTHVVHNTS